MAVESFNRAASAEPVPAATLAQRLPENPLITPQDVVPSQPGFEVVCAFNPAAARYGDDIILLIRVAERPRSVRLSDWPAWEVILDHVDLHLLPLTEKYAHHELVGLAVFNPQADPPRVVPAYLRKDLPGLDLHDTRAIKLNHSMLLSQLSHLRLARSRDGVHFMIDTQPAIAPESVTEEFGCEDARITQIGDTYYVTYVAPSRVGICTCLASTTDFHHFERHGIIFLPDHKDVVIFPGKVQGKYWALTRPMPSSFSKVHGIWLSNGPDLLNWGNHVPLGLPRHGMWDELRTGGSNVPILTQEGWLVLYHGVDSQGRYCMGAMLLDAENPRRVLARSAHPLLAPEALFERQGFYGNVVFSCGHVPLDEEGRTIRLYYGASDSVTAAADFSVDAILGSLKDEPDY
ncbi:MAG: glycoside hydrolase family 130 protein [Chloroflexi bacterium]|nr:glycoside hydrolase family 130 protein [Chloroflexota bacterium]